MQTWEGCHGGIQVENGGHLNFKLAFSFHWSTSPLSGCITWNVPAVVVGLWKSSAHCVLNMPTPWMTWCKSRKSFVYRGSRQVHSSCQGIIHITCSVSYRCMSPDVSTVILLFGMMLDSMWNAWLLIVGSWRMLLPKQNWLCVLPEICGKWYTRSHKPLSEIQPVDIYLEEEDDGRWCYCHDSKGGDMVACDNKNCGIKWFHMLLLGSGYVCLIIQPKNLAVMPPRINQKCQIPTLMQYISLK